MKQDYIVDTETNALTGYTMLHCVVLRAVEGDEVAIFRRIQSEPEEKKRLRQFIAENVKTLIGHNLLGFDVPVLVHFGILDKTGNGLLDYGVLLADTLVLSRVLNYNQNGGHSLEAWGNYFKVSKSDFSDFSKWSQELEDRCVLDTDINKRLYNLLRRYLESPRWKPVLELEHLTTALCNTIGTNGFLFNLPKAHQLSKTLVVDVNTLVQEFQKVFPKKTKLLREITPVLTAKGSLHSKDFRWLEPGADGHRDLQPYSAHAPFSLFQYHDFNPNSPAQRVQRLNEAGWKPVNKTKGHIKALRDKKTPKEHLQHFAEFGWTCDEENLATLPDTAPEGARKLKEYLLKASRLGDLTEWISACTTISGDPRGYCRVYPTLTNPGAWSMRVSHQRPNMANIPATIDRKGKIAYLGKECRELWTVPEGWKLVGVDADSIQLRIFANLCEDLRLIAAIEKGNKDDKTDIHHLNLRVMHPICTSREAAKTLIYALLLGAGINKIAEILQCTRHEATIAYKRILDFYPGWKKLIDGRLTREGSAGYIECLDGRYLKIPEARLALAGHLQSGEKIVTAKAAQNWWKRLNEEIDPDNWKLVNWVHDEWQTEVLNYETLPQYVGECQVDGIIEAGKQLKMNIALAGQYKIGDTWADTH